MIKLIKSLYFTSRFFRILIGVAIVFFISYWINALFVLAALSFYAICILLLVEVVALFRINAFFGERILPDKFSNGDENVVSLKFENVYNFKINLQIIDEIPVQFQKRDFLKQLSLDSKKGKSYDYLLKPTQRGEYVFGNLNCYVSSPLRLIKRRYRFQNEQMVKVYPSFIQMKKYDFLSLDSNSRNFGLKKVRRIGHSMEFEQIKEYVKGDDVRDINWRATAKQSQLMVNQFQDEKSQPIYSVIDKGRVMKMPFDGLALLDYAINAALVISNIALKKQDKAGILAFSKKVENIVVAERRNSQMNLILETLYNVKTDYFETDFSRLYADVKRNIKQRSLMLLYTNFETLDGLHRQLPYLKGIAKNHLLVVIFFKNTELHSLITEKAETVQQAYDKVIAEKFAFEKRLIVNELQKYGVQSILTTPQELTLDTINKYLEIKARGLL